MGNCASEPKTLEGSHPDEEPQLVKGEEVEKKVQDGDEAKKEEEATKPEVDDKSLGTLLSENEEAKGIEKEEGNKEETKVEVDVETKVEDKAEVKAEAKEEEAEAKEEEAEAEEDEAQAEVKAEAKEDEAQDEVKAEA